MAMILDEDQLLLQKTAADYLAKNAPVAHLRALRDAKDATGYSTKVWKEMAELGFAGITLPEAYGGSALGFAELGVVLEETGRVLLASPFLSTVVLGANAVLLGGSEAQRSEILPGVASGDTVLALAFQEGGRFAPYAVETKATRQDGGFRIDGEKLFVLDGHVADRLIVAARTSGGARERDGITLFVVDPATRGVGVERTWMVDSRNAARVALDGAVVPDAAVLGAVDAGADVLDPVFDRAFVAVAAELLGVATEAFERTVAYLKTREQFGVKIGSFQALKHRAALMFCELELSRSIVLDALRAIDEDREEVPSLASAAKARLSDASSLVTREGIQMHGGIGMTDEEEIGFFLKRAKAAELFLGDAGFHRDRFATLQGF